MLSGTEFSQIVIFWGGVGGFYCYSRILLMRMIAEIFILYYDQTNFSLIIWTKSEAIESSQGKVKSV